MYNIILYSKMCMYNHQSFEKRCLLIFCKKMKPLKCLTACEGSCEMSETSHLPMRYFVMVEIHSYLSAGL